MRSIKTTIFILSFFINCVAFGSQAKTFDVAFVKEKWVSLSYNKIPPNQVQFADGNLEVKVNQSAGPLVFKLESPTLVSGFELKGNLKGSKKTETSKFDEDSILRVGFVATGKRTLSGLKKLLAADWVKKLFSLAPPGAGLDRIHFFNISDRPALLNQSREHPKSDLLIEKIVGIVQKEGSLELKVKFDQSLEVAAVWLSLDGDDTASKFETQLSALTLTIAK